MKNYFIQKSEVPEFVSEFIHGNSNFAHFHLNNQCGWLIESAKLEEILPQINGELIHIGDPNTDEVCKITLVFNSEAPVSSEDHLGKIEIGHWDGKGKERFVGVIKEVLLPALDGKNVYLHVPHGRTKQPHDGKDFQIFIWSQISGDKSIDPPNYLWGYKVDCMDAGYPPSHNGIKIYNNDNSYVVAELIDEKILYIHHDVVHFGTSNEEQIFRKILALVVDELTLSPEQKEKRRIQIENEKKERIKQQYAQNCLNGFLGKMRQLENDIKHSNERIKDYQKTLVNLIRETKRNQSLLNRYCKQEHSELRKKFIAEYDHLLKLEKVNKVIADDIQITIHTDILYCTDPRSELVHEIGEFEIVIFTNGEGVQWINKTRQVNGGKSDMMAPHINSDGEACLGSIEESFTELIANYEYATLAMLAIQFVETVNTVDDWGSYIHKWPVKK